MPSKTIEIACDIARTPRVLQIEGMFDVPPSARQVLRWEVDLPIDNEPWHIGLIVGPSGSGKSTVARQLFGPYLRDEQSYQWSDTESIVDGFPEDMPTHDLVALLSSIGFSSPPSWLRPFNKLSKGEQFRVTVARMLAENLPLVACDEFTSTVDRTVAQISSAAIAKTIRRQGKRLIAITCHEDIEEWLQPDWMYRPSANQFARRSLRQRPAVELEVHRVTAEAWPLFRHHHYLDTELHPMSQCYMATWRGRPVAFSSWLSLMLRSRLGSARREHRTVCLPDYQGIGIGNALSDFCASIHKAMGHRATSTTSHPAMIASRMRSPNWKMTRPPTIGRSSKSSHSKLKHSTTRMTAGFEYVGPSASTEHARALS
jgi:ABC-type lipoprotein export system ATPase subunit/GNAT superfamily N-acetyltransferase